MKDIYSGKKVLYSDSIYVIARFEVPGEIFFFLEIEAETILMGVVGSTQNIFDFVKQRIQEALETDTYLQYLVFVGDFEMESVNINYCSTGSGSLSRSYNCSS